MKSILITGASSGLGRACAIEAAQRGWQVTACGRSEARLRQLTEQHANIDMLAFDITDLEACRAALAHRRFDAVLLNAGTCEYVDVEHWDVDLFRRVFEANFFGVTHCLDPLIPNLGEKSFIAVSESGTLRKMRVQVCDVNKAFLSVRRVTQAGNRVIFEENGGWIEDIHTGERMWMQEKDGQYLLKLWAKKGEQTQGAVFRRQGQ